MRSARAARPAPLSPRARPAIASGSPHVTLDLREEFRRAVVTPVRPRLRARRDAEPVHPLQRRLPLRRAARVRAPHRCAAARNRPLRAHRRARRPAAARARLRHSRRIRATCSRGSTRASSTASGSRSASRRRTRHAPQALAAGLAVARRAESQEACFLAGDDYRSFLEPPGARGPAGDDRRRGRRRAREPRRLLAFHARPAPRPRRGSVRAALRTPHGRAHEHGRRRPAGMPSPGAACRSAGGSTPRSAGPRRSSGIARPAVRGQVETTAGGFRLHLDEPAYGVARGQAAVLYDGDVVVGSGLVTSTAAD